MAKKICGIATLPGTVKSFMLANLNYMADRDYSAYCICNDNPSFQKDDLGKVVHIPSHLKWGYCGPIEVIRQIRWFYRIFKKEKFGIIQYATFNAAFPASIAGWLAHVPVRINLQWGMSYASSTGWQRVLRRTVDKITCVFSTSVQPDSKSNLKYAIEDHLYPARKGYVLYNGSACGADLKKFDISKRDEWRAGIREKHKLQNCSCVFGYVGRVVPDKGINELLEAFMNIGNPNTCLLLVGGLDHVDELNQTLYQKALGTDNIIFVGPVPNPAAYFASFDFMLLPSYHEGFGMTVLESAAVGTPPIITNIKGPTDFVVNDVNGLVCEVKSVSSLQEVLNKALNMPSSQYEILATNAYNMVKRDFDSETYREEFYKNRENLLSQGKHV